MISNAALISISSSTFQRFGPGSYGTFMYSTCTTLDLLIQNSVLKCYDNAYTYSTDLQTAIEYVAPYGNTKSALYIGNSVAGIRSYTN